MRIGHVTSWICNYGTILQCYAIQSFFKRKGIDIVLLIRKESGFNSAILRAKKLLYLLWICIAHPTFIKFYFQYLGKSHKDYSKVNTNQQKKLDFFRKKVICHRFVEYKVLKKESASAAFDFFVCGSDQIWNPFNVFLDEMFFLRFSPSNKKVALAPSFGCEDLPVFNRKRIISLLSDFKFLSVREETGQRMIKKYLRKDSFVFNDPVFLFSKKEWLDIINESRLDVCPTSYVCFYFLDPPNKEDLVTIKNSSNLIDRSILVFGPHHRIISEIIGGVQFVDADPFQFIKYLANSQFIYTDSFHGTAFATIMNKDFLCLPRNYGHQNNQSTRITSLLDQLNILDRFGKPSDTAGSLIDFDHVNRVLASIREKDESWIDSLISHYESKDSLE